MITNIKMIPSVSNNDNNHDENVRIPDSVINEQIISPYESDDEEMNLALEVSRNEYLNENNGAFNDAYNDAYNDSYIGTQLKLAINLSIDEETVKLEEIAKNESIKLQLEVERNLEIDNRKKSLEEFLKRIRFLPNIGNDYIEIKPLIENILNDYFELNIDYVYIEKHIYDKIYKIIDSYYLIPIQKKYKKTGIPESEDIILRIIFREKT